MESNKKGFSMMQAVVNQWLQELKGRDYTTWALTIAMAGLILFGGFKGYSWYVQNRERNAQLAMSEAFAEYDHAVYQLVEGGQSQEVIQQKLEDAHLGFDQVVNSHKNSNLVASAHAFEADIYWYEGKKEQALDSMEKALESLKKKSPLTYVLRTKYALLKMETERLEEGLADLQKLATDEKNPNADTAAFYLGYYHWCNKDESKAREAWDILKKFDGTNSIKRGRSPWLAVAEMKMSLVS